MQIEREELWGRGTEEEAAGGRREGRKRRWKIEGR